MNRKTEERNRIWIEDCQKCNEIGWERNGDSVCCHEAHKPDRMLISRVGEPTSIPQGCPILAEQAREVCEWKKVKSGWDMECGTFWHDEQGCPTMDKLFYCPRCGRRIKEV